MTNVKSTKHAFFMSMAALLLCFAMLLGTTYAWFTDTATSGCTVVQSGKLDIVLEYWDGDSWEDAEGTVLEFIKGGNYNGVVGSVLWEPGCTYELPKIRVRNEGNLTAYVVLRINGIKGDEKLLEAITFTTKVSNVPDSLKTGSHGSTFAAMEGKSYPLIYGTPDGTVMMDWSVAPKGEITSNTGHADTSAEFTISGHMKEEAGNEYQDLKIEGVSITVLATQEVYEYDSFGREYDKDAEFGPEEPQLPAIGISAEACTWEQISQIGAAGLADDYFDLGDTKTVALSDGTNIVMEIVAFDADIKTDGTAAPITWISKNVVTTHVMNSGMTADGYGISAGGWGASELRAWLQSDYYATLPQVLKDVIVTVQKKSLLNKGEWSSNNSVKEAVSEDTLWIPSICEINPNDVSKEKNAAQYYDYFTKTNLSERYEKTNMNGETTSWWLRSSATSDVFGKFHIAYVLFNQGLTSGDSFSHATNGVVIGFCS